MLDNKVYTNNIIKHDIEAIEFEFITTCKKEITAINRLFNKIPNKYQSYKNELIESVQSGCYKFYDKDCIYMYSIESYGWDNDRIYIHIRLEA